MGKKLSVDIVLPIYHGNIPELGWSVRTLVKYLKKNIKEYNWTVVLGVNGKQPKKILGLCKKLKKKYKNVDYAYTSLPGKGNGVIEAWKKRKPDIYSYMDVDLSTDLRSFKQLIDHIRDGYDISIGSRYHKDSIIKRSLKRFIISKGYITFFYKAILKVPVNDAQCGFKALNHRIVSEIIPLIKDKVWFWESEMLYLAYKKGFSIKEVPVVWTENPVSGVNLIKIIPNFIKNVIRMRFTRI